MKKIFVVNPPMQLLLLLLVLFCALPLTGAVGMALAPAFGFSPSEASAGLSVHRLALARYLMAVQSVGVFLLPPALAALLIWRRRACIVLGAARPPAPKSAVLTALAIVASIPFISFSANVNAQLPLPEWASRIDQETTKLTMALIFSPDAGTLLLNLLVVALMPAAGEELLFRGYLQRLLCRWTGRTHLSIFLSAAIFSAIHVQLEGFIPRFLLGALFGYLLYWSGSLWLPIIAHFTNNAVTVCASFYAARRGVNLESPEVETAVSTLLALASVLVAANMLAHIRRHEKNRRRQITAAS